MNNTIIDIPGINLSQRNIFLEGYKDSAHLIFIKDEYSNEVTVTIINGEIKSTEQTIKK